MWVGKVHAQLRLLREETVFPHFGAVIVRERAAGLGWQGSQVVGTGPAHGGRILGF